MEPNVQRCELIERDISLYFHIPFCERKCIYCDFYSIEDQSSQSKFVDALCKEIGLKVKRYPELRDRRIRTLFFGGGTPSLLTPSEFEQIVTTIRNNFTFSDDIEFTLECNPGTVTLEKLSAYKSLGANRLSFGVQSFHQDELDWLSRIHSAQDARDAVKIARESGFDNINIDLMFALPGQTKEKLRYSLEQALSLGTEHISAYNLTIEEGTPLNRMVKLQQVSEMQVDDASDLYELVQNTMGENGYNQYEISNYSKSESLRCNHNLVYWDGYKEYVSFGPSAHEFFGGERSWNLSSLDQYLRKIDAGELPRNNSERPKQDERRTEILFCGLRSIGIDRKQFQEVFDEDLMHHPAMLSLLMDELIQMSDDRISLTIKGYRFCDAIVIKLMQTYQTIAA